MQFYDRILVLRRHWWTYLFTHLTRVHISQWEIKSVYSGAISSRLDTWVEYTDLVESSLDGFDYQLFDLLFKEVTFPKFPESLTKKYFPSVWRMWSLLTLLKNFTKRCGTYLESHLEGGEQKYVFEFFNFSVKTPRLFPMTVYSINLYKTFVLSFLDMNQFSFS